MIRGKLKLFLLENNLSLSFIVVTIAADALATRVAKASAAMALTWHPGNIPVAAPNGLTVVLYSSICWYRSAIRVGRVG